MTISSVDILEKLNDHKQEIQNSYMFYRPIAKIQKINVLAAATRYLAGDITKEQFLSVLDKNKHYPDAFGLSKTKTLIDAVLKEEPSNYRTPEGYVRILSPKLVG